MDGFLISADCKSLPCVGENREMNRTTAPASFSCRVYHLPERLAICEGSKREVGT